MSRAKSEGRKQAVEQEADESSFWSAAGGFDDAIAEEHASKIVALWELGGEFEALKPARGHEASDDASWSAGTTDEARDASAAPPEAETSPGSRPSARGKPHKAAGADGEPGEDGEKSLHGSETNAEKAGDATKAGTVSAPSGAEGPASRETSTAASAGSSPIERGESNRSPASESDLAQNDSPSGDEAISNASPSSEGFHPGHSDPPVASEATVIVSEELTSSSLAPREETDQAEVADPREAALRAKLAKLFPQTGPRTTVPALAETLRLPTSNHAKLLVIGAVAAVGLLAILGGTIVWSNSTPDGEEAKVSAAPPEIAEAPVATPTSEAPSESAPAVTPPSVTTPPVATPRDDEPSAAAANDPTAQDESADEVGSEPESENPSAVASLGGPITHPIAAEAAESRATAILQVRTVPANAALTLDGREVENPYRGELEVGSEHRFVATAQGRRTRTRTVNITADETIVLRLLPPRAATTRPARSPRSGATRATRRRASASSEPRGSAFMFENPY